jgi:hypothetical protein
MKAKDALKIWCKTRKIKPAQVEANYRPTA